jgi:cyclohexanecarboxylate-CoA ligase
MNMSRFADAPRYDDATAARFREQGYWTDDTLETVLAKWSMSEPDRVAVIHGSERISFGELHLSSRRMANGLIDLGLRKGDVVAIQMPNIPEFLIAYLGVALMGGVLSPLHMPYRGAEIAPLVAHVGARAIICGEPTDTYDCRSEMQQVRQMAPDLEFIIGLGDGLGVPGDPDIVSFEALATADDAPIADPPVAGDWVIINFTSGTSSAPKAVLRSYEPYLANARISPATVALDPDDVMMSAPPFSHGFGLYTSTMALYAGAANLLLPQYTPEAFATTISEGRATLIWGAPAHLVAALKAGHFEKLDFSSVRDIVLGGSVCPPDIADATEKLLPSGQVSNMFGLTEGMLTMQTPLDAPIGVRHASTGIANEGLDLRITDDDGHVLDPGEAGELEMRGYSVTPGYLRNDAANATAFGSDGWYRTGDLATIDQDGNVYITGRNRDIINRGSIKINPTDVENILARHPAIVLAAIVPMPDEALGERGCLFATLMPGEKLELEAVTTFLADNDVAKLLWPEHLVIVNEMPMTPTRKIIKGDLQKLVGEVQFSEPV